MRHLRVVTAKPLDHLWDDDGIDFGQRLRALGPDDIKAMLREGGYRFAEASIGNPLLWIPSGECFAQWRKVQPNVASTEAVTLDDFPGSFCHFASEWRGRNSERIILLEKHH